MLWYNIPHEISVLCSLRRVVANSVVENGFVVPRYIWSKGMSNKRLSEAKDIILFNTSGHIIIWGTLLNQAIIH